MIIVIVEEKEEKKEKKRKSKKKSRDDDAGMYKVSLIMIIYEKCHVRGEAIAVKSEIKDNRG